MPTVVWPATEPDTTRTKKAAKAEILMLKAYAKICLPTIHTDIGSYTESRSRVTFRCVRSPMAAKPICSLRKLSETTA